MDHELIGHASFLPVLNRWRIAKPGVSPTWSWYFTAVLLTMHSYSKGDRYIRRSWRKYAKRVHSEASPTPPSGQKRQRVNTSFTLPYLRYGTKALFTLLDQKDTSPHLHGGRYVDKKHGQHYATKFYAGHSIENILVFRCRVEQCSRMDYRSLRDAGGQRKIR
jgi:hypothetical protein